MNIHNYEAIITSTHVYLDGTRLSKEALESMVGVAAVLTPNFTEEIIGEVFPKRVVELHDGEFGLEAEIDTVLDIDEDARVYASVGYKVNKEELDADSGVITHSEVELAFCGTTNTSPTIGCRPLTKIN